MSVRRIALGLDPSEGTRHAVEWTAGLAAQLGASVVVIHGYQPLDHLDEIGPGVDFAEVRQLIESELAPRWAAPILEAGVEVTIRVIDGAPGDAVVAGATETGADLIVVGARRMGLVRSLALGSTSQRVLHHARVPVVVVHPDDA